ncbi:adenosylmethionine decarboxylase [Aquimarina hainanensis]|uniref:S-adenosylmethionine decarboxylase proenzyme n=1 Tax=Aquimarina hainanensis TaxID=1578017 RepID=A0ABW5N853_9FLAO|nr:adenosylmethionine decarboxylase [Aquimarina sp. TRL1]QKX04771.1 adenosylmethionine decarboxylase [Aquimarina sp. TRL1]
MPHLGLHCTWDVYTNDTQKLSYVPYIREVLHKVVDELGLSKVQEAFKQFDPIGVTGFILLEESHISIHTWPEHSYAAIDVFSCKDFDVTLVKNMLADLLHSDTIEIHELKRGNISQSGASNAS